MMIPSASPFSISLNLFLSAVIAASLLDDASDWFRIIPTREPITPAKIINNTILNNGSGNGEMKKARGRKIIKLTSVMMIAPLTLAT